MLVGQSSSPESWVVVQCMIGNFSQCEQRAGECRRGAARLHQQVLFSGKELPQI